MDKKIIGDFHVNMVYSKVLIFIFYDILGIRKFLLFSVSKHLS